MFVINDFVCLWVRLFWSNKAAALVVFCYYNSFSRPSLEIDKLFAMYSAARSVVVMLLAAFSGSISRGRLSSLLASIARATDQSADTIESCKKVRKKK